MSQPETGRPTNVRMDTSRLFRWLLLTFILPLSCLIILDFVLNLRPYLTILGVIVVIPLATFFVVRVTLDELNRVIRLVAPEEPVSATLVETAE